MKLLQPTETIALNPAAVDAIELKNAGTKLDPDYFIQISLRGDRQIQITKPPKGLGWAPYYAIMLETWRQNGAPE